ncbi:hypothetical protein FRC16_004448 [Serendipita sp. 398]|nr:hypothetical protein FRC16_004448 [Serendipita sp. 398]
MCGTPSYLAPEVVLQDALNVGYDHKVDSWSVGAIVFAMLTGQGAFREDENQPLSKRVRSRTVTWEYMDEVGCSSEAIDFVNYLLQNNPDQRMSLAEALRHPWLYPTYCPSGLPSYFHQPEPVAAADSPHSMVGSVMSAPVGTPLNGVSEDFQNLEIDNDSAAESPAYVQVDFEDAKFGGPSDLTRSQLLRKNVEEREQSWDIVDEPGDPEQTPLARPRLQLLDEENTTKPRPAVVTNLPPPLPLQPRRIKRKLSSGEVEGAMSPGEASSSGNEPRTSRLGARKASKASQYDSPTTATRARFANGALNSRKTSLRNGKGPIGRDFIDGDE